MFSFPSRSEVASHLGLVLILALVMFSPLIEGGTTHLAAMIMRLLILSAFLAYVIQTAGAQMVLLPRMVVGIPVVLFLGLVLVSTLFSPYPNQSTQWLIICMGYAGLLYLLAVFLRQWKQWAVLHNVLVVMALFEAGVVFFQFYVEGASRPSGTFFNPNYLAGYLAAIFVSVLASACYSRVWHRRSWATWHIAIHTSLPFIILPILAAAIGFSGSRGGALALAAGAAVVIGARFGRHGLLGLLLLTAMVVLVPNPIRERALAEHQQNPVTYARWHMWQGAVQEMVEHPLGVGAGLYQYVYAQNAVSIDSELVRYGKTAQTAHNEYLQIGVELGVAGLGVFLWGIALLGREAVSLLRQRLNSKQRVLSLGACAGIVVILTQAAVDSNLREPAIAILLVCCAGMVSFGRAHGRDTGHLGHRSVMLQSPGLWATVGVIGVMVLGLHVVRLGIAYQWHEAGAGSAKQRQLEEAIGSFQTAIRLDPGKALYHSSLAGTYFQVYQRTHEASVIQASLDELQTAITLNPLDGRLRSLMGHVLVSAAMLGRSAEGPAQRERVMEQAVEAYEQAAELEPFVYSHQMELARMMLWFGRRDDAERRFRRVIALEPNFLPAREALIRLCVESGRKQAAEVEYKEILARQRQFSNRITNQLEREFLHVDAAGLEALLAGKRSAT